MVTKRLSHILSANHILTGHNFCGLKEESTVTPLNILNNVMEDAKEHHKELWILTQDMAKAYDSISMEDLRMSLNQIGIPTIFTNWIIDLFEGQSMQVITAFGLSPSLNAADVIDQGDSISPLLWRIFYDPLLSALQSDHRRGYQMNIMWPANVQK